MNPKFFQQLKVMVTVLTIIALTGPFTFRGVSLTPSVSAAVDSTIKGKVVDPNGKAISFECLPPPGGTPLPAGTLCSIGVGAFAGPETQPYFTGASPTDGSFSLMVEGGRKYKIEFHAPPEKIGQYTLPATFIEIASGQTLDLGTIKATQKQGHIKGKVVDDATGAAVANVAISAFPFFQGPPTSGSGEPPPPIFPSTATTNATGDFDILVTAGRYIINLEQRPDSQYVTAGGPPVEANVETDTSTVTVANIKAIKADATIKGNVVDANGAQIHFPGGVGARPVGATDFRDYGGPIMPPGVYEIKVPSAASPTKQFTLVLHLPPDMEFSVKGEVTVTVIPNGVVTQNLTVAKNTSSIFGKVIDKTGFALSVCKASGDKFKGGGFGEVFAHNPKSGSFTHAQIKEDCTYKLSVGAGEWQVGHHLNPHAGFINRPAPPESITVEASQNVEKNIVVEAGDATINVQVFGPDGKPLRAWVEASNDREVHENYKNAGRGPGPGAGPGAPGPGGPPGEGEFRGPGGTTSPEEMIKYCTDPTHKTECQNFKLPPGASGPGGCTDMYACAQYCLKNPQICAEFDKEGHDSPTGPTGPPVLGQGFRAIVAAGQTKINAEEVTKGGFKGPDLARDVTRSGTETDSEGKGSLLVSSGSQYEVRAFLPPDRAGGNLLPPKSVAADLRTAKTATVVLQFQESFGAMTGKVTLPDGSAAKFCFVHYWSQDGSNGGAPCNPNGSGTFSLGYSKGTLHFNADSFDPSSKKLYRSDEQLIIVTTQKTLTQNFSLQEAEEKAFAPLTKTFKANETTTISLDNGAQLTIPAGAMGTGSENMTISVTPTVSLNATETVDPEGVGYSCEVKNSSGQEVTDFSANITLKLPYEGEAIEEETGLDERFLSTKFVDDNTGSYQDPDSATQDTENDSFTISDDHCSDWTVISPGGENLQSVTSETVGKNTKVTIGGRTTVTLKGKNWNVSTGTFGSAIGQLIIVSNQKSGGRVIAYNTSGRVAKKVTPIKGFKGGLNQLLADVTGTGTTPDGTDDVIVGPATEGPAKAVVYNVKINKFQTLATGTGKGKTTISSAELISSGVANLTTLFNGKEARAFKMAKGKLVQAKGKSVTSLLSVNKKSGVVEKKVASPKVKRKSPSTCSKSATTKLTLTGSGFNGPVVALWNAENALAATASADAKKLTVTINPSAVDVNAVNTLTIVNADGQAGVAVIQCK